MEEDFCLQLVRKKRCRQPETGADHQGPDKADPRADLTDESCSAAASPRNSDRSQHRRRLPQSRSERVFRLRRLETEEGSQAGEASERGLERPLEACDLNSCSPVRCRDSDRSLSKSPQVQAKRDLGFEFESSKGVSEKKVPLAPRNKTKIMFNFDKGYLADRSVKPPLSLGVAAPQPSMTDQLTLRIASIKQSKKAPVRIALDLDLCEKQNGNATSTLCRTNREDCVKDFEERLKEKDLVIDQLRREVDLLNVKNDSLINEVFDLRQGMERLQSQLNVLLKAQPDLALDLRPTPPHKHTSKTQPDQSASREVFGFSATQPRDKPQTLGPSPSKLPSAKKVSQAGNVTGAFKRPGVMMLTPKGINKISFHSKSTPQLTSRSQEHDFVRLHKRKNNKGELRRDPRAEQRDEEAPGTDGEIGASPFEENQHRDEPVRVEETLLGGVLESAEAELVLRPAGPPQAERPDLQVWREGAAAEQGAAHPHED